VRSTQKFVNSAEAGVDLDLDGIGAPYDCATDDANIFPGAVDVLCDGIDQNCDGVDSCDSDLDGAVDSADCDPNDPHIKYQCLKDEEGHNTL